MSTPKKVLFVNHTSIVSGAEMVLLDVVSGFKDSAAFLFERGALNEQLEERGLKVFTSRFGAGFSKLKRDSGMIQAVPMAGRMAVIVCELAYTARKYDVIYANSQKAFTLASIAATFARRPLIWHLHDILDGTHFGARQRQLQIYLANRAACAVVAPSLAVESAFVSEGGTPQITKVIPNGLDLKVDPIPKAILRRQLDLPSGPLVGVFSRIAPWKGQHVVIRALANLPNVRCIIVGSPLFGEDSYDESLKTLVAKLNLQDRVQFLGQRSDISRLMQAVDIVIHPSVSPEPFGRTLVEAMLVNTPLIATDTGAAREILGTDGADMLVPPGDTDALIGAIRQVLSGVSPAQLQAAKTRAIDVYGVSAMRRAIADVVEAATNDVSKQHAYAN